MVAEISGSGIEVVVTASPSFPTGITCRAFADDTDPLDIPDLQIAESAMGVNGDLVTWRTPKPIEINLNIIPNTDEDIALTQLADLNRVAKGKLSVKDIIVMTVNYPDGTSKILANGIIQGYSVMNSITSNGRFKTKNFKFVFENKI